MDHLDPDRLVQLALDDRSAQDAGVRGHLDVCPACHQELEQLIHVVDLARESGEPAPVVLPASIWTGIADELGIGTASDRPPARVPEQRSAPSMAVSSERPSGRPVRRLLLAAAAVALLGLGVGLGTVLNRPAPAEVVAAQSSAALAPMPKGPPGAHGTAIIAQHGDQYTLTVQARQLPLRQGFYEVWLYDPAADKMIAVGTLGSGGDGSFTLAPSIDLRSYSVIDVSAQDFDGNPAHQDSVLQGTLTR